eukprot:TRINITY_DN32194_c0_g1_i1.p1 TRINITY_DN32194_c0_g1~~TRINITY_DN32194_c0_g1_i1.p1  ORF type:complete len:135 (+),score=13.42 TRINITY_DN32194_c0_g1_i1:115-519(+)
MCIRDRSTWVPRHPAPSVPVAAPAPLAPREPIVPSGPPAAPVRNPTLNQEIEADNGMSSDMSDSDSDSDSDSEDKVNEHHSNNPNVWNFSKPNYGSQSHSQIWQAQLIFHLYLCLLYTSPSPRDLSTSRMPSSA